MSAESNRLFFALWPTEAVRAQTQRAAADLKIRMQPTGRPVPIERYHVTLLFLGDQVAPEQQAAALRAADQLRAAPFKWTLEQANSFQTPNGYPWWLGPRETPPALRALYDTLRKAVAQSGVEIPRSRLTPHLTIRYEPRLALPPTAIQPIAWNVDEFVLIRSPLDGRSAEYELLGRWPLNAAPEPEPAAQLKLWG